MQKEKPRGLALVKNGILDENPVLKLILGTCPTLAISVTAMGSLGMGIVATIVLIGSNAVIAALRNVIPEKIRIPCYITIIAAFVTIMSMLVEAFAPGLFKALGVYLELIVVNCIILGRAEMFASKNPVGASMLDGLGMGLGFTLVITIMGIVRELFGAGTVFGLTIFPEDYAVMVIGRPAGGFIIYGCAIAILSAVLAKRGKPPLKKEFGCGADCTVCGAGANCEQNVEGGKLK